jgi:hypothetical protein
MSIDTKSIIRERENYRNTLERQQKAFDSELGQIKENNESQRSKIKENFMGEKKSMEETFQDRYQRMDKSQQEALFDKERVYANSLNQQSSEFQKERKENIDKFNKEFSTLNNEYSRMTKTEKNLHDKRLEDLKRLNQERVETVTKNTSQTIEDFKNNNKVNQSERVNSLLQEQNLKKSEFDQEINKVVMNEQEKRNFLQTQGIKDIELIKEKVNADRELANKRQEDKFKQLNVAANEKVNFMREKLDESLSDANEKNRLTLRDQEREFGQRLSIQEKNNNENLRSLENKNKRQTLAPGSLQHEIQDRVRLDQSSQMKEQKNVLIQERQNILSDSEQRIKEANESFKKDYVDLKENNAYRLDQLQTKNTADLQYYKMDTNEKQNKIAKTYQENLNRTIDQSDKTIKDERKQNINNVNEMKVGMRKKLDEIDLKNREELTAFKKDNHQDKKIMFQRINQDNAEKREIERKNFLNRLSKVEDSLKQEIYRLEVENKDLKEKLDDTVYSITQNHKIQVDSIQQEARRNLKAELALQQTTSLNKEESLRNQLIEQKRAYDRKMDESTKTSEKLLKKLSMDNIIQLKEQEKKYQDIIDQTNKFKDREIARISLAHDDEKNRLINQYENQISKMKLAYEKKQTEIDEFNKLSVV